MSPHDVCDFLERALQLGYAGAGPWAYRAKDPASRPLLGQEGRAYMLSFATEHADEIEF